MRKKDFARRLVTLIIGVLIGFALGYAEPADVPQQVGANPDAYRLDIAQGMGALTQSQCFCPTDGYLEYAYEMVRYTPEDGSSETYLQHLTEGMKALIQSSCIEPTDGCLEFATAMIKSPCE
jgi:hypothetical protein